MTKTSILIFIILTLLFSGCSRENKTEFSILLVVDGREAIKEVRQGKKAERAMEQYAELRQSLDSACLVARFFSEQISQRREKPSSVKIESHQLDSLPHSTLNESASQTKLAIIPPPGQVITCDNSQNACSLKPAGSQLQRQYGLEAQTLLISRYGMKSEAVYESRFSEKSPKGDHRELLDRTRIQGDTLTCQSLLSEEKGKF